MVAARFTDTVLPLDHEWVTKYRMPCVEGFYTKFFYPVALVVPGGEMMSGRIVLPSEAEVELLAAWAVFYAVARHPYIDDDVFRTDVFTVIPGADTYHFGKTVDEGWLMRASSWNDTLFPKSHHETKFWTLADILNHVSRHCEGWAQWKQEHSFFLSAAIS